ncbi:O-antigen ligase family protein [Glutamicibacter bergerei]
MSRSAQFYAENQLAASMFGNTNDFATYLLVSLSILVIAARTSRHWWSKFIFYITVASSILLVLSTDSRANIISIFIWSLIIVITQARNVHRVIVSIFTISITFICLLFVDLTFIVKFLNLETIFNFTFDNSHSSDGVRLNLSKNGIHFLIETMGFGTGAGNIEHWMETRAVYPTSGVLNIHNWWLEILVAYGVLVFVGYITMILFIFIKLIKSTWQNGNNIVGYISAYLFAGIAAFVISSISSSSNISSEWLWVYFAVIINFATRVNLFKKDNRVPFTEKKAVL